MSLRALGSDRCQRRHRPACCRPAVKPYKPTAYSLDVVPQGSAMPEKTTEKASAGGRRDYSAREHVVNGTRFSTCSPQALSGQGDNGVDTLRVWNEPGLRRSGLATPCGKIFGHENKNRPTPPIIAWKATSWMALGPEHFASHCRRAHFLDFASRNGYTTFIDRPKGGRFEMGGAHQSSLLSTSCGWVGGLVISCFMAEAFRIESSGGVQARREWAVLTSASDT